MTRVIALAEPPTRGGPEYTQGLRAAVSAGVDYAVKAIGREKPDAPPVPETLLAQARLAARSGVGLDTVLRRYVAGHGLLGDFLVEEAEEGESSPDLKRLLRRLAASLDRLLIEVTEAHRQEEGRRRRSAERRRAELVERLLAGEPLDPSELAYGLEGHHLGLVAAGVGDEQPLRALAASMDRRLLLVSPAESAWWVWLGGRRPFDAEEVEALRSFPFPPGARLALGEPGQGIAGWRLTHRQAKAGLLVAVRRPWQPVVRYADVALLAALLQDETLATSLRRLYLEPLERGRDGGEVYLETLRAYFAAGQNVSSTAAALRINRSTAGRRLQGIEERLGKPLSSCAEELAMALRLGDLEEES